MCCVCNSVKVNTCINLNFNYQAEKLSIRPQFWPQDNLVVFVQIDLELDNFSLWHEH